MTSEMIQEEPSPSMEEMPQAEKVAQPEEYKAHNKFSKFKKPQGE